MGSALERTVVGSLVVRTVALTISHMLVELAHAVLEKRKKPLPASPEKGARPAFGVVCVSSEASRERLERDLRPQTRLDAVSRRASELGIHAGWSIAQARARHAELTVVAVGRHEVVRALEGLAEPALAWGRTVAIDVERLLVCLDIDGCAHLFADSGDPTGEHRICERWQALAHHRGHRARLAVADGPRLAAAFAGFGGRSASGVIVVRSDETKRRLEALPIEAAHAFGLSEDDILWLHHLGVDKLGDLERFDRKSLGFRLGRQSSRFFDCLEGHDDSPLDAHMPSEPIACTRELEEPTESVEVILFVAKSLCDRVFELLRGRGLTVSSIDLEFELDMPRDANASDRVDVITIGTGSGVAGEKELFSLVRTRLEGVRLRAPAKSVTLRSGALVPKVLVLLELFDRKERVAMDMDRLVRELEVDLSRRKIGLLRVEDSWLPEQRSTLISFADASRQVRARGQCHRLCSIGVEPTRLVREETIASTSVKRLGRLERLEAIEWWKRPTMTLDYLLVWHDALQALAWVTSEPSDRHERASSSMHLRGWID